MPRTTDLLFDRYNRVNLDFWLSDALNPVVSNVLRLRAAAFWRAEPADENERGPTARFEQKELGAVLGKYQEDRKWKPLPAHKVSPLIRDCERRGWLLDGSTNTKLIVNPMWLDQQLRPRPSDRRLPDDVRDSIKRLPVQG